jgi:hypothetical protein
MSMGKGLNIIRIQCVKNVVLFRFLFLFHIYCKELTENSQRY